MATPTVGAAAANPSASGPDQDDVNAACLHAVRMAQLAWAEGAQERRTQALEALAAGLDGARGRSRPTG